VFIATPASAAPVLYLEEAPSGISDVPLELLNLGSTLTVQDGMVIVGGRMGVDEVSATVLDASSLELVETVVASTAVATGESRLASVTETESGDQEVHLYKISATEVTMLGTQGLTLSGDFERLGTAVAVSQSAVAIVDGGQGENPDEILILQVDGEGTDTTLTQVASIKTGLANTHVEILGDLLAVSGVPPLGNVGHLVMYDLTSGSEVDRINNIGGGPIVLDSDALFVQRNQFFVRPSGTWTRVELANSQLGGTAVLPGAGSTLAVENGLILLGDPIRDQVLVFTETADQNWPFRFVQAVRDINSNKANQFGASVAIRDGSALIGVPSLTTGNLVLRGAVLMYGVADGPVGCTVVGTPGDDEKLTGTSLRDTLCGLDGDDRILGFGGDDVIYGGAGDDVLLGNGGNDTLYGEDGNDILNGGDDDDLLIGDAGDDTGNGGAGDDNFVGGSGRDKGNGGEGTNTCDSEQRFLC
jgi:Ca2+-binding RTX toxin-like protein